MTLNLNRLVFCFIGSAVPFVVHWLGTGHLNHGPPLAMAGTLSVILGIIGFLGCPALPGGDVEIWLTSGDQEEDG